MAPHWREQPLPDERARPGAPPSRARIEWLARSVAAGTYRVNPHDVAEAMLSAGRARRARLG